MMGQRLTFPLSQLHSNHQRGSGMDQVRVKRYHIGKSICPKHYIGTMLEGGESCHNDRTGMLHGTTGRWRRFLTLLRKVWFDWDDNLGTKVDYNFRLPQIQPMEPAVLLERRVSVQAFPTSRPPGRAVLQIGSSAIGWAGTAITKVNQNMTSSC